MRKVFLSVCVCSLFFVGTMVAAIDLGVHGCYHYGDGTAEQWNDNRDYNDTDYEIEYFSIGGILNLPLGSEGLLSNRLMLLYETGTKWVSSTSGTYRRYSWDFEFDKFSIYDTLAFRLYEVSAYRLWLGPQVGVFSITGDDDLIEADWTGWGVNLGAALGLDYYLQEQYVLSGELGLRYGGLDINADDEDNTGATLYGPEGYLGVSFMMRL